MVKQEPNSFFALWPKGFTQNDPVHYQTKEQEKFCSFKEVA